MAGIQRDATGPPGASNWNQCWIIGAQTIVGIDRASVPQNFCRNISTEWPACLSCRLGSWVVPRPGCASCCIVRHPRSAPTEFRRDVFENALERMCVVVHAQLVRNREEQRIGRRDGLVARELYDQHVGFCGVRAAADRPRVGVDITDLTLVSAVAAEL